MVKPIVLISSVALFVATVAIQDSTIIEAFSRPDQSYKRVSIVACLGKDKRIENTVYIYQLDKVFFLGSNKNLDTKVKFNNQNIALLAIQKANTTANKNSKNKTICRIVK